MFPNLSAAQQARVVDEVRKFVGVEAEMAAAESSR
jgi:hypothetical protein